MEGEREIAIFVSASDISFSFTNLKNILCSNRYLEDFAKPVETNQKLIRNRFEHSSSQFFALQFFFSQSVLVVMFINLSLHDIENHGKIQLIAARHPKTTE